MESHYHSEEMDTFEEWGVYLNLEGWAFSSLELEEIVSTRFRV